MGFRSTVWTRIMYLFSVVVGYYPTAAVECPGSDKSCGSSEFCCFDDCCQLWWMIAAVIGGFLLIVFICSCVACRCARNQNRKKRLAKLLQKEAEERSRAKKEDILLTEVGQNTPQPQQSQSSSRPRGTEVTTVHTEVHSESQAHRVGVQVLPSQPGNNSIARQQSQQSSRQSHNFLSQEQILGGAQSPIQGRNQPISQQAVQNQGNRQPNTLPGRTQGQQQDHGQQPVQNQGQRQPNTLPNRNQGQQQEQGQGRQQGQGQQQQQTMQNQGRSQSQSQIQRQVSSPDVRPQLPPPRPGAQPLAHSTSVTTSLPSISTIREEQDNPNSVSPSQANTSQSSGANNEGAIGGRDSYLNNEGAVGGRDSDLNNEGAVGGGRDSDLPPSYDEAVGAFYLNGAETGATSDDFDDNGQSYHQELMAVCREPTERERYYREKVPL